MARKTGSLDKLRPMHGIPFSVKDMFDMKGFLNTYGMAWHGFDVREKDALIVAQMRRAGGIPLVRGNMPQSGLSIHCENYVFGEGKNPHDKMRSPGGSSGGDAGMIAQRCVPLGLGSDIGGSLRWPPVFCGVYGLKPSYSRVSKIGTSTSLLCRKSTPKPLAAVNGPMGSSVNDLVIAMEILCDENVHKSDPDLLPHGWHMQKALNEIANKSTVKVGILAPSPLLPVSDAVLRAIRETREALEQCGYEVVDVEFPDHFWRSMRNSFFSMIANDVTPRLLEDIDNSYEKMLPSLYKQAMLSRLPAFARKLIHKLLPMINQGRVATMTERIGRVDKKQYEQDLHALAAFKAEVSQFWVDKGLSCLVSPLFPHSAPLISHYADTSLMLEYAIFHNVTGYPVGVLPVTNVAADEEHFDDDYNDSWTKLIKELAVGSVGMPIGVQFVGYIYEDEKVLAIMKDVEAKLKYQLRFKE